MARRGTGRAARPFLVDEVALQPSAFLAKNRVSRGQGGSKRGSARKGWIRLDALPARGATPLSTKHRSQVFAWNAYNADLSRSLPYPARGSSLMS